MSTSVCYSCIRQLRDALVLAQLHDLLVISFHGCAFWYLKCTSSLWLGCCTNLGLARMQCLLIVGAGSFGHSGTGACVAGSALQWQWQA